LKKIRISKHNAELLEEDGKNSQSPLNCGLEQDDIIEKINPNFVDCQRVDSLMISDSMSNLWLLLMAIKDYPNDQKTSTFKE
jgi:hypothetical protein